MKKSFAIQTVYKGYKFRSRLEARWALFFDAMKFQWDYEPEGFDLGATGWYLPDFYLHDFSAWVEIKPKNADQTQVICQLAAMQTLGIASPDGAWAFFGDPLDHVWLVLENKNGALVPAFKNAAIDFDDSSGDLLPVPGFSFSQFENTFKGMPVRIHEVVGFLPERLAARQARFEHGERKC